MKASELMIGDWVNYRGIQTKVTELKFKGITDERLISLWNGTSGFTNFPLDDKVTPIPLTPEILEKNGFEQIENKVVDEAYIFDRNEFEEPDIIIRRFDFNDSFVLCTVMDNTAIISIAYVHQLQHALRLCGIEKEITL